jgi:tyramine---L-glutamate ligase
MRLGDKITVMKRLKILVFEYIIGGGLNKADLPEALANEGLLMLQALLNDFVRIDFVDLLIMLDYRMVARLDQPHTGIHIIEQEHDSHREFKRLMQTSDAVWPIAPESDCILQTLCAEVGHAGKLLLNSPASAVVISGDKWLTYGHLLKYSTPTVKTQKLAEFNFSLGEWIIKPIDGVGCENSFLIADQQDFELLMAGLDKQNYIIQPHIQGQKTSLSCLFKQGRGWLVCANLQHFTIKNKQYQLTEITVNFTDDTARYEALVNDVAKVMPDLWGYVGIDLIETGDQVLLLEINPRLTTSYAGIYAACGINCARVVLDLIINDPQLLRTRSQAITIKMTSLKSNAN